MPVWRDNPRASASGLLTVQVDKPFFISLAMISSIVDLAHYGVSHAKDLGILGLWFNKHLMWKKIHIKLRVENRKLCMKFI